MLFSDLPAYFMNLIHVLKGLDPNLKYTYTQHYYCYFYKSSKHTVFSRVANSGFGIQCFTDPWIRDPGSEIRDPRSGDPR